MIDERDSFVRGAWVISTLTLVSRLLGVARDVLCAAFFGAGIVWDAFSFAFRIPNLFRRLFGEGALSAAFVPELSTYLELRSKQESEALAGRVAGALMAVLLAAVVMGEAIVLGATRVAGLSPRWHLALSLTAVLLPYTVLVCLTAFAGATLHSLRHFAAPALAPVVLNVLWILGVGAVAPLVTASPQGRIYTVASFVLLAGIVQLLIQVVALHRKGFRWRPIFQLLHPDVRRVASAMAPVALGLAAVQLNVLFDGVIAISLAHPEGKETFRLLGHVIPYPMAVGANSVLYYANRLMQFPLGVFGIALATAAFPALSAQAARQDWDAFSRSILRGLRLVLFIGIPAGAGLILLRRPLVELLFERGAFTPSMSARAARALAFYATAVWAYCALHVLTRAFYSMKRPGVPARVAGATVVLNLGLNLTLVWPLREAGLALATAICALLQVVALYALLHRRVDLGNGKGLVTTAARTLAATALMGCAAWVTLHALPGAEPGVLLKVARAVVPACAGVLAYGVGAAILRMEELGLVLRALQRKNPGKQRGDDL
ncbi:MAG: murein biosynthesis integral membrane protein MurJ [Candidatus Brocadiaceae bacterium]|jgi:putative peptidoglycan lipid II flippase